MRLSILLEKAARSKVNRPDPGADNAPTGCTSRHMIDIRGIRTSPKETAMANREQRGGKETRKPKKDKVAKSGTATPMSGTPAKPAPVAWKQAAKKP
jgi:hypothetical protein